jgi:hypothetical protein
LVRHRYAASASLRDAFLNTHYSLIPSLIPLGLFNLIAASLRSTDSLNPPATLSLHFLNVYAHVSNKSLKM